MKKIHIHLRPLLAAVGASRKASDVYLALLETGPSTIAGISRSADLHRPDVYAALPKLRTLGLVGVGRLGRRQLYHPAPSSRLLALARRRLGDSVKALTLVGRRESGTGPMRVLQGESGLRSVLEDLTSTLKNGSVFYRVSSRRADTDVERYIPSNYRAERDRKRLEQFVITNSALRAKSFKRRLECLSKAVPKDEDAFDVNAAQLIYGEKVAFIDYNTETAVIIENPTLARFHERLFRLLFKRL
ncbi:MAG: helix-turn-helix domain-containing protein [Patescibacteria group bacterium]